MDGLFKEPYVVKNLYLDTETTGLNPQKNGLIQISGAVEIEGKEKEKFNFFVKPFPEDEIDPKALSVSGTTTEKLETYPAAAEIYGEFKELLKRYVNPFDKQDKFFFVAYNARFDWDFLEKFFSKNQDNYFRSFFFFPPIDVMYLAAEFLKEKRYLMENFKLASVASMMGIELKEENLHDAEYDIYLTQAIYHKIQSYML